MKRPAHRSGSPDQTRPRSRHESAEPTLGGVPEDTAVRMVARREIAARSLIPERGLYGSPYGFALAVTLDENGYRVPAVADAAERLRPLVDSLDLVNRSGGFRGRLWRMTRSEARVVLRGVQRDGALARMIEANKAAWVGAALDGLPRAQRPREAVALELAAAADGQLDAYLYLEPREQDAAPPSGAHAATLRRLSRALAPRWRELTRADADVEFRERVQERVQVRCAIPTQRLADRLPAERGVRLEAVVDRALRLLEFALSAPDAAHTENQSLLGAVSRVALALGHDPRRISSDGHAHASRFGGCSPLVRFERRGALIIGSLELPLELEPHGRQQTPEAEAALNLTEAHGADDLRVLAACVGLASQLPTLETALGDAMRDVSTSRKGP